MRCACSLKVSQDKSFVLSHPPICINGDAHLSTIIINIRVNTRGREGGGWFHSCSLAPVHNFSVISVSNCLCKSLILSPLGPHSQQLRRKQLLLPPRSVNDIHGFENGSAPGECREGAPRGSFGVSDFWLLPNFSCKILSRWRFSIPAARRGDKGAAASRGERQNTAFKVRKDRPHLHLHPPILLPEVQDIDSQCNSRIWSTLGRFPVGIV